MTVLHRAWTWIPEEAHHAIADDVVEDGVVSIDALRQSARLGVEHGPADYLHMMTFDHSLLEEECPDEPFLYVVALGRFMEPIEGIAFPLSLHDALCRLNWGRSEADALVFGDPLTTLPTSLNDPLMNLVRPDLTFERPFGGWLSIARGSGLLARLNEMSTHFVGPPRSPLPVKSSLPAPDADQQTAQRREMYRSAITLLEALQGLPDGHALRCIAP